MPREGISNPELTLTEEQRKIETLNFNPAVDCILASSSHDTLNLWDLIAAEQIYAFDVRTATPNFHCSHVRMKFYITIIL